MFGPRRLTTTVVGFVLALGFLSAESAARQLTLEDYYRIVTVQAPVIPPAGTWVAFVRTVIVEAENRRHSEIWTVPADGRRRPRLTSPPFVVGAALEPRRAPAGLHSRRPVAERVGTVERIVWFLRMDGPAARPSGSPGSTARRSSAPTTSGSRSPRAVAKPTPRRPRGHAVRTHDDERSRAASTTG